MDEQPLKVFISYSHDSPRHKADVLGLAYRLRHGIDCALDQYVDSPPEGWPRWMQTQIEQSKFVVVVCTKNYHERFCGRQPQGTGKGAKWEGAIITQELYDSESHNTKFIPVVFNSGDAEFRPSPLKGVTFYDLSKKDGFEQLYRRLTSQPLIVKPPLSPRIVMPVSKAHETVFAGVMSQRRSEEIQDSFTEDQSNARDEEVAEVGLEFTAKGASVAEGVGGMTLSPPPLGRECAKRELLVSGIKSLFENLTWIAIYGTSGTGKTNLALHVAEAMGGAVWIRLRDMSKLEAKDTLLSALATGSGMAKDSGVRELSNALCSQLKTGSIIVIDDLPDCFPSDSFGEIVLELCNCARRNKISVLSTSYRPISIQFTNLFGKDALNSFPVPAFSDPDVLEMALLAGAPEEVRTSERIRLITSVTKGHPVLVSAAFRYLEQHKWEFSEASVSALLRNEHATQISNETLARLIETVDAETRDLLYRLNLVGAKFTSTDVEALAAVLPSISVPAERLHRLNGFCVQQETADTFTVSPLFSSLGSANCPKDVQKACRLILGDAILSRGGLDWYQGLRAAKHFAFSKAYEKVALLMSLTAQSIFRAKKRPADFGALEFWIDSPLPQEMALRSKIIVRSYQVRSCRQSKRSVSYLVGDLLKLMLEASDAEMPFVFLAIINAEREIAAFDTDSFLDLLSKCVRAHSASGFSAYFDLGKSGFDGLESETELAVRYIKTPSHLMKWSDVVGQLTEDERKRMRTSEMAESFSMMAANRLWLSEADKPVNDQRWTEVGTALHYLATSSRRLGMDLLWANAVRAQMIVKAEYLNDLGGAIAIGSKALDDSPNDSRLKFLLAECVGRQFYYKKKNTEAIPWFRKALAYNEKAYTSTQLQDRLYLSSAVGASDPAAALQIAADAVEFAKKQANSGWVEPSFQLETVKALCELTTARYLSGDLAGAFFSWDDAARRLFAFEKRNTDWKNLVVVFGHISGFLSLFARTGEKLERTRMGDEYCPPYRGLFLTWNDERVNLYQSGKDASYFAQLTIFADGTGDDEKAVYWAERTLEAGVDSQTPQLAASVSWSLVAQDIRLGRYGAAIKRAIRFNEITGASMKRHRAGAALDDPLDVDAILKADDGDIRNSAESQSAFDVLISVAAHLGSCWIRDEANELTAREAIKDTQLFASQAQNPTTWNAASEVFRRTYVHPIEQNGLIAFAHNPAWKDDNIVRIVSYLCDGILHFGSADALRAQLAFMPMVDKCLLIQPSLHRIVVGFVTEIYWTAAFTRSRFRFATPSILERELQGANGLKGSAKLRAILSAVARGLELIPDKASLDWIRTGAVA